MVKAAPMSGQEIYFQTRKVLYLRFGTECPAKSPKPPVLLAYSAIAKILKIDEKRAWYLVHKYFGETLEQRRSI